MLQFIYHHKSKPFAVLAVASLFGKENKTISTESVDPDSAENSLRTFPKSVQQGGVALIDGESDAVLFTDVYTISRHLARVAEKVVGFGCWYHATDPLTSSKIDYMLDFARMFLSRRSGELKDTLLKLNKHLTSNGYLVNVVPDAKFKAPTVVNTADVMITLADLVAYSIIKQNMRAVALLKKDKKELGALLRWQVTMDASTLMGQTAKDLLEAQHAEKMAASKGGSFNIKLPGAKMGQVVTRFPPEPSGYLHIGHVKAVLLNDYFAKSYKGKMLLRFDDTNPSKEKQEYVESIKEDLVALDVQWASLSHTSDHFEYLLEVAEKLLQDGKVYIDDTPVEQMREEKKAGIPPKTRDRPLEKSMALWKEMKEGTPKGLTCCMRGKLDPTSHNKTLFDPVFYRCNIETPHVRTGTKYKVYPTYDFACPIVDSLEGVTHTLRTDEYHERDVQYLMILDIVQMRKPSIWEYSRLNFMYTLLSKRKLKWFVETGRVEGWNDPRFPTVRGVLRRGMTVPALREFMLLQGASKAVNCMSWNKIWSVNKKIVDPVAPRVACVDKTGAVPLTVTDIEKTDPLQIQLHPKKPEMGKKAVPITGALAIEQEDAVLMTEGEEVTLMGWGNAIVTKIEKADNKVTGVTMKLHLAGNVKTTKKKVSWVNTEQKSVPVKAVEFDYLITVEKMDGQELEDVLTKQTVYESEFIGEAYLANVKVNDIVQLTRRGFYRCDVAYDAATNTPITLFAIPDSKTTDASVLSTKVAKK